MMGNDDHRDRLPSTGTPRPLPPGFRFRPTDEELLTHYLARKAADPGFAPAVVREVDLYRAEPWDLVPAAATNGGDGGGEDDGCRYFFCARRVKFPSGLRANRATRAGYWKSTGKDKVVAARHGRDGAGGVPLGVKKTLVFYRGRAPKADKTSWAMHEYRLIEWVVCRVFMKKQPPGEASQQQETVLHPPHGDHLQVFSTDDVKTTQEAAATAASSEQRNPFNGPDDEAIAPGDHHETNQGLQLQLNHEGLLMVNFPETEDDMSSSSALAQGTLLRQELAADYSSLDLDGILPLLLDYEGFPFVHDHF